MKKGINCCPVARLCSDCEADMEATIYLVQNRGGVAKGKCERCGRITMTSKVQYTMKGAEMIRRGVVDSPPC